MVDDDEERERTISVVANIAQLKQKVVSLKGEVAVVERERDALCSEWIGKAKQVNRFTSHVMLRKAFQRWSLC